MTKQFSVKHLSDLLYSFKLPVAVLAGILVSLLLGRLFHKYGLESAVLLVTVAAGSLNLIKTTVSSLLSRKFALDYIAILAITVGILSGQYLVAAVIVLMLTGGNTLEAYGMNQAKRSLTALTDRIPDSVFLYEFDHIGKKVRISSVQIGEKIAVRKGEVIPLDGILFSPFAQTDESSLTGEPYLSDKIKGDLVRSGTVNVGNLLIVTVTKNDKDSTYSKIIEMVRSAQSEKAPLIRLADRYSTLFTLITLLLAGAAYLISHDFGRVLAVLVIATPCPLILATPIALMGGMNAAAKKRIILKKIAAIEVLSRVSSIIFDKTGTITLGKPVVKKVVILDSAFTHGEICAVAEAIERNSLHPLAKAVVAASRQKKHPLKYAVDVVETIGKGISGKVDGRLYTLSKVKDYQGMAVILKNENKEIAVIEFADEIKKDSKEIITELKKLGLEILIFTGDRKESADEVVRQLGLHVTVRAECTPEDKSNGIMALQKLGKITAMVGDGINDAPALALADVGMVFSNEEHTAASEAADVVFLGGDFSAVTDVIAISKNAVGIAYQSIITGITLSTLGMILAVFGFIPALTGAFFQEAIDIAVILNALRASR